ncbi:MAG: isoprenylcysteine carboxylmethyltransferase family protein [Verrucomicrobia bacterium]|nr:isoprenylcysteine carboxylmethyltransferase family protein [Verrucomicrobiota bacterium]
MPRSRTEKIRVPISYMFAVALLALIAVSQSAWEERSEMIGTLLFAAGIMLAGAGALGRIWCSVYIAGWKQKTLVTDGPYSVSRNPLYVFSLIGGVGVGLATETMLIPLILALFFLMYYPGTIRNEEKILGDLHGDAFQEYMRTVPRFWPRFSLLKEAAERQVNPIVFRKHLSSAVWFIWLIGIVKIVEELREMGVLPTILKLY